MKNLSIYRIFSIVLSLGICTVAVAATDEREAEYAELRQKIEKKIGPEKLQDLDNFGSTVFNKWAEWDGEIGSAQRYFRGGRIGTEEEKQLLVAAYMDIKCGQGYLLQAEFHQDPKWRKFTQEFFDLIKAPASLKKLFIWLERYDKKIGYQEATGPVMTADQFFSEYAKRRPKIEEYTNQIFSNYNIPKRYLLGIRYDATIEVWTNFGAAYFSPELDQDYIRYRAVAETLGKFN